MIKVQRHGKEVAKKISVKSGVELFYEATRIVFVWTRRKKKKINHLTPQGYPGTILHNIH